MVKWVFIIVLVTYAGFGWGVIDGVKTDLKRFPWQVLITKNGEVHYGGSLISKKHILTAAHCFTSTEGPWELKGDMLDGFEIRGGGKTGLLKDQRLLGRLAKVAINNEFEDSFFGAENDAAIVFLENEVGIFLDS